MGLLVGLGQSEVTSWSPDSPEAQDQEEVSGYLNKIGVLLGKRKGKALQQADKPMPSTAD